MLYPDYLLCQFYDKQCSFIKSFASFQFVSWRQMTGSLCFSANISSFWWLAASPRQFHWTIKLLVMMRKRRNEKDMWVKINKSVILYVWGVLKPLVGEALVHPKIHFLKWPLCAVLQGWTRWDFSYFGAKRIFFFLAPPPWEAVGVCENLSLNSEMSLGEFWFWEELNQYM